MVVGRIAEVAYEKLTGNKERFSTIVSKLLFEPLHMDSACFYLDDGDSRIAKVPQLYGGVFKTENVDDGCDVKPFS